MINLSQKITGLISTIIVHTTLVFGQTIDQNSPQTVITGFLYALYQTNLESLTIAKRYIALQDGPNELSVEARYRGAAEHLTMLRQGQAVGQSAIDPNKPILYNPAIHKILPYKDVVSQLAVTLTDEQRGNAYVLVEDGKPLRFFLLSGSKISSFDYMVKGSGGPAYFLGY